MANTFTLIATTNAASSTTVTFTNIPSTYDDLVLKANIRGVNTTSFVHVWNLFINNVITTSYSSSAIIATFGSPGTASGTNNFTVDSLREIYYNTAQASNSANQFTSVEVYFPAYTKNTRKTATAISVFDNLSNAGYMNSVSYALDSTGSAISRLDIQTQDGFWNNNSLFSLYGIKNT